MALVSLSPIREFDINNIKIYSALSDYWNKIMQESFDHYSKSLFDSACNILIKNQEHAPVFIVVKDNSLYLVHPGYDDEKEKQLASMLVRVLSISLSADAVFYVGEGWSYASASSDKADAKSPDNSGNEIFVCVAQSREGIALSYRGKIERNRGVISAINISVDNKNKQALKGNFKNLLGEGLPPPQQDLIDEMHNVLMFQSSLSEMCKLQEYYRQEGYKVN